MPMGDSELATEWIDHDPQGQDAWVKMAQLRLGSGIIVALMILFVPLFGPDRFAVVMITGSIAMLGNLALLVHARRGGVIGLPVAVLDTLTTVIFVALVPNAFIAGLMILLGCAAMWVFWVGLRPTVAMLVVSSVSWASPRIVETISMR